jgi:hypothetical protein
MGWHLKRSCKDSKRVEEPTAKWYVATAHPSQLHLPFFSRYGLCHVKTRNSLVGTMGRMRVMADTDDGVTLTAPATCR